MNIIAYDVGPAEVWVLSAVFELLEDLIEETDGVITAKWEDYLLDGRQLFGFCKKARKRQLQVFNVQDPNNPVEGYHHFYVAAKDKQTLDQLCRKVSAEAEEMASGMEIVEQE